ncbi:MAG TPA: DUF2884 family protein [Dokdonella sp.]
MPPIAVLALAWLTLAPPAARAEELADVCHASSSYDLTIAPDSLIFDRPQPAPRRIDLRGGKASVDGVALRSNAEDADRLALFEQDARSLMPKAKAVATSGVDLLAKAVRAEAAALDLSASAQAQVDARLAAHIAQLKRRIAASTSTHDWQGDALDRYAADISADLAPLVAADLGAQALDAAVSGDLERAASLRDRAAALGSGDLPARLEHRLQALRPQILALCPSIQRLYELQRGVRDAKGRPLDLIEVDATD